MVSLHVEPTSRCTLACPRCERTWFMEKFGKSKFQIHDLSIETFKSFVNVEIDQINFCGNIGDPIYHPEFIDLVKEAKTLSKSIKISTNGSRKSKEWWLELTGVLESTDIILFSVDGIPENFTEYRVNGDWDSVKTGIEVCATADVKTVWKYIPFRFNEGNIEQAKQLSQELGMDRFSIVYSDRWQINDQLKPSNEEYTGNRSTLKLNYKQNINRDFEIDAKCSSDTEHYISADGLYAPCCFSKNYEFWYKSEWWRKKMHISKYSLSECIEQFKLFYKNIDNTRPDYCVFNCGKC